MTRFEPGKTPTPPPPPPVAAPASANGHVQGADPVLTAPPTVVREASAPRKWTAKGLAAAVMFVVIGGLILMYAIPAFSTRDTVLVVAKAVPVGSTITDADLTTAEITSDPALKPIKASDRGSVVGKVAMVNLSPGGLVTRDELGTSDGFTSGQVLVALGLKEGQFPARGLSAGQQVLIVATPGSGSGSSSSGSSASPTQTAGTKATVTEVGSTDAATGVTVVDVRVSADVGVAVAQLASTGNAALILLPTGG
ncbi:MAG: uncharacterized protein JWR88_713 [Pseudonocardia sp.]|nr:uncharacterized protein [Pseudonocardia sp.]